MSTADVKMAPREAPTTTSGTSMDGSGKMYNGDDVERQGNQSGAVGLYLRWSRLEKVVDVPRTDSNNNAGLLSSMSNNQSSSFRVSSANKKAQKTILNSVSGYAAPGQVLACMGPSGSGKTSLLNILSGRTSYREGGIISFNDEIVVSRDKMKKFLPQIAYVQQDDIFFDHLTVRDQLSYTAKLRMPNHHHHDEVEKVLHLLRLNKVADSQILQLSGGEKKRVNIGTELLTSPSILLLDEPTSGLDSTSAVSLLKLLRTLAKTQNCCVITTIHQPSSSMFHGSFDRLLLLSEGSVVYFGTPQHSLQYLDSLGMSCPAGYNAADHWMDLLVQQRHPPTPEEEELEYDDKKNEEEDIEQGTTTGIPTTGTLRKRGGGVRDDNHNLSEAADVAPPRLRLEAAWDNEAIASAMDRELSLLANTNNDSDGDDENTRNSSKLESEDKSKQSIWHNKNSNNNRTSKYNTSWATQYYVLTHRAFKNSRSAIFTPLNLIKSFMMGIVAGLLWYQTDYTERNVNDIRSYYFFTMTFWVFDSMFTALTAFPSERTVILKERASGSYRLSAYFLAKTTADAPVRIILPLIYMAVSYWMMAGTSGQFTVFLGTISCTLLSVVAGEAMGLLVGSALYDLQKGLTVMTVFVIFLMLLGGFFVENVPSFIAWAKFLSPFKYAFDSSLQLIFDRDVPCDGSGVLQELCTNNAKVAAVAEVHDSMGIQGTVAFNVGMLLVICFLPRYVAYLFLRAKKSDDRS